MLDSVHLGPVEVWQVWSREVSGEMSPEEDIVNIVPQQAVVDLGRHRTVVHCELPQS